MPSQTEPSDCKIEGKKCFKLFQLDKYRKSKRFDVEPSALTVRTSVKLFRTEPKAIFPTHVTTFPFWFSLEMAQQEFSFQLSFLSAACIHVRCFLSHAKATNTLAEHTHTHKSIPHVIVDKV